MGDTLQNNQIGSSQEPQCESRSSIEARKRIFEFVSSISKNEDERYRDIDRKSSSLFSLNAIILALLTFVARGFTDGNLLINWIVAVAFILALASLLACVASVWPRSYVHPRIQTYASEEYLFKKQEDEIVQQLIVDLEAYYKWNRKKTESKARFLELSLVLTTLSILSSLLAMISLLISILASALLLGVVIAVFLIISGKTIKARRKIHGRQGKGESQDSATRRKAETKQGPGTQEEPQAETE